MRLSKTSLKFFFALCSLGPRLMWMVNRSSLKYMCKKHLKTCVCKYLMWKSYQATADERDKWLKEMDPNLVPGCLPVYSEKKDKKKIKWNVLFQLWMLSLSFTDHLSLCNVAIFTSFTLEKKRWMSDASGNQTSNNWVTGSQWTKQYTWIRTTFTGGQVKVSQSVSCLSESVRQVESAFHCQKKRELPVMGDEGWRGKSSQGQSAGLLLIP